MGFISRHILVSTNLIRGYTLAPLGIGMSPLKLKEKKMTREEILEKFKDRRTKCTVYTRVMGYHRPVESFNIGKKSEHKERVHFKEKH